MKPQPLPTKYLFTDLTDQQFNRWMVLFYAGSEPRLPKGRRHFWCCRCQCGTERVVESHSLIQGTTKSCGCLQRPTIKPIEKVCKSCDRLLPFTEEFFFANQQHPFGLRARCRKCINDQVRDEERERIRQVRIEILTHYSNGTPKCQCCGKTELEFLCIDHINGGGGKHAKERGYTSIYNWLKANNRPSGYRVLCHCCNTSLGLYGYCPHHIPSGTHSSYQVPWGRILPKKEADKVRRKRIRYLVLYNYSSGSGLHCNCCGETTIEFLALDHINGGGHQHRKKLKRSSIYEHLWRVGLPSELYRTLCHNCNQARGFYGYCPHLF